jgi:hypothetical protein
LFYSSHKTAIDILPVGRRGENIARMTKKKTAQG